MIYSDSRPVSEKHVYYKETYTEPHMLRWTLKNLYLSGVQPCVHFLNDNKSVFCSRFEECELNYLCYKSQPESDERLHFKQTEENQLSVYSES